MRCQLTISSPSGWTYSAYLPCSEAAFQAWVAAELICPCKHLREDFLLQWGKVTQVRVEARGWTIWLHSLSDPWGWYSRELHSHKDWVAFRMATCHNDDSRVVGGSPFSKVPSFFPGETK